MKKILIFSLFSILTQFSMAQNLVVFNQNQLSNNAHKGGVPSSNLTISNDLLNGTNSFAFKVIPNHLFSCFGIGWSIENQDIDPSHLTVRYRTKNNSDEWSRWNEVTAEVTPLETPTGMYWTDALFTTDATSHKELEVVVSYTEVPSFLKLNLFDGNAKTVDDEMNPIKPIDNMEEKSTTCPGFPTMITRSQWCGGSASCTQVNTAYTPTYINATHVVIHHGASPDTYTSGQTVVQSYYNYHVNTLGWSDIGYNYLVDKNGNFFQGRYNPNITASDVRGAHAGVSNSTSIGINFPGNADITLATAAQLDKVKHLLAWWFDFKGLDPLSSASFQTQDFGIQTKPRICGHRDIGQTACPGNDLYARLPDLRTSANQIITDCNACGIPTGLIASSITHNSATLNWTAANNAVSYTIQYKPTNSSTWTTTNSTTNSKIISGLNASTSYEFKVMSSCSGNTSSYSSVKTFSTLAPPQVTLTMNSGTTAYSGHPYSSSFMDELSQYIITKQELTAAGWTAQTPVLKSIAFQVSTNSTTVLNSFTIKVTHTSAASYTNSNFLSGTTLVSTYTGTITTTNGWNTYTFPTPFNYNQTSNLLITVSFNNNVIGTNSIVQSTILNEYKSIFRRENITSGTISQSSIGTQSYYRPNMRLVFGPSNSTATTAKSQFEEEAIITLTNDKSAEIIVSPNPLSTFSSLKFYTKNINFDSTVQIDVVDQNGRIIFSNSSYNLSNNENYINFVSPIEKGNYFIRLICNEGVISERFMVE